MAKKDESSVEINQFKKITKYEFS